MSGQEYRVRRWMDEHGSITSLDAIENLGCTRLSAYIFNLRRDGLKIRSVYETGRNRYGERVRYVRYVLEGCGE